MEKYKAVFDDLPWQSPVAGLRYKIVETNGMQLRLVEYSRDMEPHWCEKGHLGYVLEGNLEITFVREVVRYSPGDVLLIPDGSEHRHMGKVPGEKAVVLMYEKI